MGPDELQGFDSSGSGPATHQVTGGGTEGGLQGAAAASCWGRILCSDRAAAGFRDLWGERREKIDPPGTYLSFLHSWKEKLGLSIPCSAMNQEHPIEEKMRWKKEQSKSMLEIGSKYYRN